MARGHERHQEGLVALDHHVALHGHRKGREVVPRGKMRVPEDGVKSAGARGQGSDGVARRIASVEKAEDRLTVKSAFTEPALPSVTVASLTEIVIPAPPLKVAVTELAALIVTWQAPVPVQAPLQPAKIEPAVAAWREGDHGAEGVGLGAVGAAADARGSRGDGSAAGSRLRDGERAAASG